ncbi:YVTN family beta-propeller protein [Novosphingobium sp. PhB165]|uniref:YncE family protein n=1 Tax=Novosphingobium sp. PhB165 TaxID=2485105 RepID=UPI00104F0918|nr:gluconolactonase [Novosphingobium sp. PhB165]TCM20648.1 YVTN family beta-propeller protein [Novosphingobium sp. PhB165]
MRLTIALLAALLTTAAAPAAPAPQYRLDGAIAGPDGPWDYARVDSTAHRLYVARGGAVTVADLASGGNASSIGEVQRGHAVLPLAGGRLLVTSGTDGTVRFLNAADGHELAKVPVGKKPDAAILDADGSHAFVMNSDSGSVSVLDTAAMRVLRTIPVKPGLEYAATDGATLFINDEDLGEVETVDLARGVAGKPIALPGCEGPTGLALDSKHGRLISACANGKAAIVDAKARKLVALVDIGQGPDAVILDAARGLAFVPCGKDGVLDIVSLQSFTRVGRVKTEVGARTGALDPETGNIYLPTARFAAPTQAGGRPAAVPGSFHILVVRPA